MINILFKAYTTLAESNRTGLDGMFIYVADTTPIFIPLVLFAFFIIICFGTFFREKRLRGRGDFPASFVVAGFSTFIVAIIMSLVKDLINPATVIICLVIALIGALWLFISKDRGF